MNQSVVLVVELEPVQPHVVRVTVCVEQDEFEYTPARKKGSLVLLLGPVLDHRRQLLQINVGGARNDAAKWGRLRSVLLACAFRQGFLVRDDGQQ